MISPMYIFFLVLFYSIANLYAEGSPRDILGPSACDCYGENNSDCGTPDVPAKSLPTNCSSYLYMFFLVRNNTLSDLGEELSTIPGFLDQLIQTNIPVLVYYYHASQTEWCAAVSADTAAKTLEMDNLKCLLDKHSGVKGLILRGLLQTDAEVTSGDCPNYTQNVKAYIELMRKTFTNLSIGMTISSMKARELYKSPEFAWVNYSAVDSLVDFYVVNFQNLNQCSDEFIKTGCYPLCGNSNNTVAAMKTFLDDAGVPSTKVHYLFYNNGDALDPSYPCDANPITSCQHLEDSKTLICMDTLQTLYEKGKFAKENGVGFVVNAIDTDDFDGTCQCGRSFPAFYAILNGYNGAPPPEPCTLFDRI